VRAGPPPLEEDRRARLVGVLESARRFGYLGPTDVEHHLDHAIGFAEVANGAPPPAFLDLGAGGGVPGLVLAVMWPGAQATLLEAGRRRCAFLRHAVSTLELGSRVEVLCGRAETLGRRSELREHFHLVVARAFGGPAVTAECGTPFAKVGGRLVVSEPPDAEGTVGRWPESGLAELGLRRCGRRAVAAGAFVVLEKVESLSDRWPRRVGIPAKRPLWA